MIGRSHRFRGSRALSFVYRSGSMSRGPLFGVKAAAVPNRQTYRVAVVISKKIHKSAVARNRMRRRLYETFQPLGDSIEQPYDIVITVFNDQVLTEPASSLNRQLKKQLASLGIINLKPPSKR